MKLFLASSAYLVLDQLIPLLPDNPHNLKLAFIPTAADPYAVDNRPWFDADRAKLVAMGFAVTDYDLKGKNPQSLHEDLSKYQVIFVSGGNTYYLLNEVKKSGFDTVIKRLLASGVVYIGSSAGSVIMCPTIDHARAIEHPELVPELTDYTAIGLTTKLIAPHYGNPKYSERYKQMESEWGDKLILLRDDQAFFINGDKIELVTK